MKPQDESGRRKDKDAAVDDQTASAVLAEWATPRAVELLRADERSARWLNRVDLLRKAMPDKPWPGTAAEEIVTLRKPVERYRREAAE